MNGIVVIDKPAGCTSHDVVNRWRKLAGTKRVGHLGTLDPMATGVIVLVSGNMTRLAQFFGDHEKTYEAEFQLGVVSDTYDAEGQVQGTGSSVPEKETIATALDSFRGVIWQTPPAISAKKVNGVRSYKLARQNKPVELAPVQVNVKSLLLREIAADRVRVEVTCSAGTYIRSIAHDLGKTLGCGAVLSALRRTASGEFCIGEAHTITELEALAVEQRLGDAVIGPARVLPEFPSAYVEPLIEAQIRMGREFRTSPFVIKPGTPFVKALSLSGDLISIGRLKYPNVYHPMMVL